jgi:hypothetical protein
MTTPHDNDNPPPPPDFDAVHCDPLLPKRKLNALLRAARRAFAASGGRARARSLSAARRRAIARAGGEASKAAQAARRAERQREATAAP